MTIKPATKQEGPIAQAPLSSLRIIESCLLGPGFLTTFLSDMGAEVIKVESPAGDYIRQMTWPIVEGTSMLHLHTHRGKKSMVLDLKTPGGKEVYLDLVKDADAVVEGMRPGTLERLGLGFDELKKVNPKIVMAIISGYGATGPYKTKPSHGVAYDTWAGALVPDVDEEGSLHIPDGINVGINVGPALGALGLLAGVTQARATGKGMTIEIAQSDSAAYTDWFRIEGYRAYERPESEVTGNASDNYERRPPGLKGMYEGVRYQIYQASDGMVLFMASEDLFWKNFCEGVDRMDMYEKWGGKTKYADHAAGNKEMLAELKAIFLTRTVQEWMDFGDELNTPIAPVNTPQTLPDDPQFQERMKWLPQSELGSEQLPLPVFMDGKTMPVPSKAPEVGEHTDSVLAEVLGYDEARIVELRESGVFG